MKVQLVFILLAYSMNSNAQNPILHKGDKGFVYAGVLAPSSPKSPNHASVIEFKGEWYFFYHRGDVNKGSNHRRSACYEKLNFRKDGTIVPIVYTLGK